MNINFNLETFIKTHVTGRQESLLSVDFSNNKTELHNRLSGKKVLVIGGAGTIGSYYIKALLHYPVSELVVADTNENGLTELVRDIRSSTEYIVPEKFTTYPVDFGSEVFEKIFRQLAPFDIVANFAAHKHVRSEKDIFSVEAMFRNNVFKAKRLLRLLAACPPEHFFCVSTDKAANPVNLMGASKKLMEELIMAYSGKLPIKTARFANVAFSNGSLPLGFIERINKQQPLACPTDIKRFFVSPEESGQLCLFASVMGESGDIFFPKLDPEKNMIGFDKIVVSLLHELGYEPDICQSEEEAKRKATARNHETTTTRNHTLVKSSSREVVPSSNRAVVPSSQYPVYFFPSDTSGEKPYEEFCTESEVADMESYNNLGVIKNAKKRDLSEIETILNNLENLFNKNNSTKADIVETLQEYLPTFAHLETGKGLDMKM